jgi:hypothetical protein
MRLLLDEEAAKVMADLQYDIILDPLDEMTTLYGDFLSNSGHNIFLAVSGIVLLCNLFVYGAQGGLLRMLIRYSVRFVAVDTLYRYYYQPVSFLHTSLSIHQIPTAICSYYVDQLDLRRMDIMINQLSTFMNGIDAPMMQWKLQLVAATGEMAVTLFQAACWYAVGASYATVGILTLLGPLVFWTLMVPSLSGYFTSWAQSVCQHASYRLFAGALVFCASTSMITFLSRFFHGTYDIVQFAAVMPKMLALMAFWVMLIFRLGSLVSDMRSGASSAGSNMIGAMLSARKGHIH